MKGLVYPLVGLVICGLLAILIIGLAIRVSDWRERRAIRRARWRAFGDVEDGGTVVVYGIKLVARWGRNTKTLRVDRCMERVPIEDLVARAEARGRAELRADDYNSVQGEK